MQAVSVLGLRRSISGGPGGVDCAPDQRLVVPAWRHAVRRRVRTLAGLLVIGERVGFRAEWSCVGFCEGVEQGETLSAQSGSSRCRPSPPAPNKDPRCTHDKDCRAHGRADNGANRKVMAGAMRAFDCVVQASSCSVLLRELVLEIDPSASVSGSRARKSHAAISRCQRARRVAAWYEGSWNRAVSAVRLSIVVVAASKRRLPRTTGARAE